MKKSFAVLAVLLILVASCSKKSAPTSDKAIEASTLFAKKCGRCHGADGISGGAPSMAKTKLDMDGLVQIITKGEGHMPAFEDVLSKPEINAISAWILTLKKA